MNEPIRCTIDIRHESWPLAAAFAISRGSRTSTEVVVVELSSDRGCGRGECVPSSRYDATVENVMAALQEVAPQVRDGLTPQTLQQVLPAGAARNALDCALWDLAAKTTGRSVHSLLGLAQPEALTTAYTLSLDSPEKMGAAARAQADRPLLKSKLTGDGDLERMAAIRENAPRSTLIVDVNEAWNPAMVEPYSEALARLGVALIEQPVPAAQDAVLAELQHPVPLCADESCHTAADLDDLSSRYDVVNIKLDKTGGLTEALRLRQAARERGLGVMVGCMVGTSLAMAPAVLVAQGAEYVDLDGPLLIGRDREHGLRYDGSVLHPAEPALWG